MTQSSTRKPNRMYVSRVGWHIWNDAMGRWVMDPVQCKGTC